jgi:tyrosine-protein kinase Etk/Wzc
MSNQTHLNSLQNGSSREEEIDLRFIVNLLKAHKLFIIAIVVLCVFLGGLTASTRPTMYESTALIKVSGDSNNSSNLAALLGMTSGASSGGFMSASPAEIETSLIQSDYIMGAVAEQLALNIVVTPDYFPIFGKIYAKLSGNKSLSEIEISEFSVPKTLENIDFQLVAEGSSGMYRLYAPNGKEVLTGTVGQLANSTNTHFPIALVVKTLPAASKTTFIIKKSPVSNTARTLLKNLVIKEQGDRTGVLQLSYQSQDPNQAQEILNTILSVAVKKNVAEKAEEATKTLDFLEEQLPKITESLDSSENRLNAYRSKMGISDSEVEGQILLEQLVDLQKNISELNLNKLEMLSNFTDKHPYILAINKKQQQLQKKLTQVEEQLKKLPLDAQQTVNFERDIKVNGEIYSSIMQNMQQMLVLKGSTVSSVRVLDQASYPVIPVPSKISLILIISFAAGIFLSIFILLLRHILSAALDPLMLEKYFGVQVLTVIPFSHAQKKLFSAMKKKKVPQENYLLSLSNPKDTSVEALRSLRTALKLILLSSEKDKTIIALSGCSPNIGKSFVSSNLASLLGDLGKKVLLIDADIRRGYLHKMFSCQQSPGLSECLQNDTVMDICIQKVLPNVDLMASGIFPQNPAELLMHQRLDDLIEKASKQYDIVIIDTPPVLAVTDASILLKHATIRLLIVGLGKDQLREIEHAKSVLGKSDISVNGLICNNMNDTGKSGGGYGYGYTYNYEYK